MEGNCNLVNVVYQANVSTKEGKFNNEVNIGISSPNRKFRCYNHRQYFNKLLLSNQTVLSKFYWKLKVQL